MPRGWLTIFSNARSEDFAQGYIGVKELTNQTRSNWLNELYILLAFNILNYPVIKTAHLRIKLLNLVWICTKVLLWNSIMSRKSKMEFSIYLHFKFRRPKISGIPVSKTFGNVCTVLTKPLQFHKILNHIILRNSLIKKKIDYIG